MALLEFTFKFPAIMHGKQSLETSSRQVVNTADYQPRTYQARASLSAFANEISSLGKVASEHLDS